MWLLRYTPRLRPSASIMAMLLKRARPLSSKKLIGSTTSSSLATFWKWAIAGFSSVGVAICRYSGLGFWQKYGVSNRDRKSTRLNSSHVKTSYAVLCLKNKRTDNDENLAPATLY